MKTALITGAAGQDGVLLARGLLADGYRVIGTVTSVERTRALCSTYIPSAEIRQVDIRDRSALRLLLEEELPDEIYNLASWSSVGLSWSHPWQVTEVNGLAVLGMLEEILALRRSRGYEPRVLQASSSEMFGLVRELPQNEGSPHHPRSPYATAKSFAHHTAVNYRESYGIFVATTILFNHESPLRPRTFVTRKITSAVAAIAAGEQDLLTLGRTDVRRDWGAASDYVRAMRLALRRDEPDDYCVATGVSHSLGEFVEAAFEAAGLSAGMSRVRADPELIRPADVPETRGDPARARALLGWAPELTFHDVVEWMVRTDLQRLRSGREEDARYLLR